MGFGNGDLGEIMKIKVLLAAALSLAVVLVGVSMFLDWRSGSDPTAAAGSSATAEVSPDSQDATDGTEARSSAQELGSSNDPGSSASDAPAKTGTPKESDAPVAEATRPSWNPQPTESDTGLEVPTQSATEAFALPSTKAREPVLTKVPATGVKEGELTKGFPKDALPLPDSTTVVQSSVAEQGDLVMLGIEGRSKASVEEVLDFYSTHFEELNWLSAESTPSEGSTRIQGGYGDDSTTVTVRELPTGMTSISAAGVFKVVD